MTDPTPKQNIDKKSREPELSTEEIFAGIPDDALDKLTEEQKDQLASVMPEIIQNEDKVIKDTHAKLVNLQKEIEPTLSA